MICATDHVEQKGGSAGEKTWALSGLLLEMELAGLANGLAVLGGEKRSIRSLEFGFRD